MFDEALRLAPGDLLARSNLGLTLSRLGRDDEARRNYAACWTSTLHTPGRARPCCRCSSS